MMGYKKMEKEFFKPEPLVFAHRGFSSKYPENSILSFMKAVEIGVDVIEMDLRISKDNRFVVFHDNSLERVSDGSGRIRYVHLVKVNIIGL